MGNSIRFCGVLTLTLMFKLYSKINKLFIFYKWYLRNTVLKHALRVQALLCVCCEGSVSSLKQRL